MKKMPVNPIWVSDISPVSVNGRLLSWNVNVMFDGDLALWHNENPLPRNIEEFKKYMKWTDADIQKMEDDDAFGHKSIGRMFFEFKQEAAFLYKTERPYFLNPRLDIPKRDNISTVKWDRESCVGDVMYVNTLVGYAFPDGVFGLGHRRAKKFRDKILVQIAEKNR